MMTIMVIQVAVVILGPAPFDYAVGFWTEAAEEGPGREGKRLFRGRIKVREGGRRGKAGARRRATMIRH